MPPSLHHTSLIQIFYSDTEWEQLLWLEVQWATKQDFILQVYTFLINTEYNNLKWMASVQNRGQLIRLWCSSSFLTYTPPSWWERAPTGGEKMEGKYRDRKGNNIVCSRKIKVNTLKLPCREWKWPELF